MPVGDGILDIHFRQITTYSVRAEYRGPVLIGGKVVDHKGIGLLRIRIEDMGSKGIVHVHTTAAASGQTPQGHWGIGGGYLSVADADRHIGKFLGLRITQTAHHVLARYGKGCDLLRKLLLVQNTGRIAEERRPVGVVIGRGQKGELRTIGANGYIGHGVVGEVQHAGNGTAVHMIYGYAGIL